MPRTRIERVVNEETPITTDTALRLAKVFGTLPEFRTNLQFLLDRKLAEKEMGAAQARIVKLVGATAYCYYRKKSP